ncbi:MAG: xanthine dehydrogenase family protein subunit M [Rhodospirillales bacterium]|nr:xanthine dehydrogenase family protein subunit M [Rhodospirillales bacterium]
MKPPPFAYECPTEVADAVSLLSTHGADARPLAGGQSLVPLLNFRLARPAILVDLNRIAALGQVTVEDGTLRIGAMARQAAVEADPGVARGWPLLTEAIGHIAHPQIRNRGTIGGSLAHNDPAAELPAVMLALDAEMTAQGPAGVRTIQAEEFFAGTMETALAPDELLTEIRVPALPQGTGWGFQEAARRQGDFALVAVAVLLRPSGSGASGIEARVVVTGTGDGPQRMRGAEAVLTERGTGGDAYEEAGDAAADASEPADDPHAPGWYRRKLVAALTRRACRQAATRMGR